MNAKQEIAARVPTRRGLARNALFLSLLALFGTVEAGWGQTQGTTGGSNVSFTFDFGPPGARSLGMGGAFLGLADDATAAYTNPAGLTNLTVGGPEVAMEIQSRNVTEVHSTEDHALGSPSGYGIDTRAEPFLQKDEGQTTGLSFLSVGYVLPGGASLALYRHELLSFRMRSESQGLFLGPLNGLYIRTPASQLVQDATVVNLGLSGAYEVQVPFTPWKDSLSLGVGVSLYHLDLLSRADRYLQNPACGCVLDRGPDGFFGPNLFLGDLYTGSEEEVGDDNDIRFSLGVLWKIGERERWRLGGVYRQSPRFSTRKFTLSDSGEITDTGVGSFTIPDSYGVGVAYSTNEGRTKVALDYNRIRYSQRRAELVKSVKGGLPQEVLDFFDLRFEIKDSDQLHLGFEQVFPILEPDLIGTLRLGAWREPAHELEYVGSSPIFRDLAGPALGKAQNHFAVGLGVVLKENVEVDVAADFSDLRDTVSVSIVKFF